MKRKHLLKSMLLLCALMAGSSVAWAETYTLGWGAATGATGTFTNFTAVSGTVTDIVSFSAAKNSSGSNPAYNSSNSELRLYYHSGGDGGSITLTPATGVTITGAVVTTSTSPSVNYSVDGGSATSVTASSNTYTVSGISATKSLTFQNVNTSNTQLRIKTIQITYTKVDVKKYTATFSVNGDISSEKFAESADIDFPAVNDVLGMKFVGWTTSAIVGTQDSEPATLLTEADMGNSDITYYAVFAYIDLGQYVLDYSAEPELSSSTSWGTYGTDYEYTATDGSKWVVKAYKSSGMQVNIGKNSSIKIPACPSNIKSIEITCSAEKAVGFSTSDYSGSGTIDYVVSGTDATSQTLDFTGESVKDGYIVPKSGSTSITKIIVKYSDTSISKDYCTTIPTGTITLNADCNDGENIFGTYSNSSAFIVPSGLTVSEVAVVEGKLKITNYNTGAVVPAGTGVMVSASTDGEKLVALTSVTGTAAGTGNCLHGTGNAGIDAATMAAGSATGTKFYRLTMHNGTTIGYWWGAADGAAFALAANKAYLAVPADAFVSGFTFDDITGSNDQTTGISAIEHSTLNIEHSEVYTLSGQRVSQPTKGLYIVNGKKVIVK